MSGGLGSDGSFGFLGSHTHHAHTTLAVIQCTNPYALSSFTAKAIIFQQKSLPTESRTRKNKFSKTCFLKLEQHLLYLAKHVVTIDTGADVEQEL